MAFYSPLMEKIIFDYEISGGKYSLRLQKHEKDFERLYRTPSKELVEAISWRLTLKPDPECPSNTHIYRTVAQITLLKISNSLMDGELECSLNLVFRDKSSVIKKIKNGHFYFSGVNPTFEISFPTSDLDDFSNEVVVEVEITVLKILERGKFRDHPHLVTEIIQEPALKGTSREVLRRPLPALKHHSEDL